MDMAYDVTCSVALVAGTSVTAYQASLVLSVVQDFETRGWPTNHSSTTKQSFSEQ
jgi:hypothetical protein